MRKRTQREMQRFHDLTVRHTDETIACTRRRSKFGRVRQAERVGDFEPQSNKRQWLERGTVDEIDR